MGEDGTVNAKAAPLRRVGTSGGTRAVGTRALSGNRRGRQDDGFTPIISRLLAAIFLGRTYLFIAASKDGIFARVS